MDIDDVVSIAVKLLIVVMCVCGSIASVMLVLQGFGVV